MAFIDSNGLAWEQHTTGVTPLVSLSAKSATNSVPVVLDGVVTRSTAVLVVNSSAGVSAGSVQLYGSLDGTNFYTLGSAVSTSSASTVFAPVVVTSTPFRYLKAVIATTITGGTITATVAASG
jgi:hypothetical protein